MDHSHAHRDEPGFLPEAEPLPGQLDLDTLSQLSPDVIALFDQRGRHRFVSPAVEAATGIPASAWENLTHREVGLPEPFAVQWEQALARVFSSGQPDALQFEFPSPGGARAFDVRLSPVPGPDGRTLYVLAAARDVTALRQTEAALRRSEGRYRLLAEHASDMISLSTLQGRLIYVSPVCEGVLGLTVKELMACNVLELLPPEDRARALAEGPRLLSGEVVVQQHRMRRADGRYVLMESTIQMIEEPDWGEGPLLLAISRDITELRKREVQLETAQRLVQIGFWEWEVLTDRVTWSNEQFRIYGHEPGAFAPTLRDFIARIPEEERADVERIVWGAYEARRGFQMEHHVLRPDGERRLIRGIGEVELDASGHVVRMFGTDQDITEIRRIEEEAARKAAALDQARQLDRIKSEFVGSVSHELRTPLTSIRGFTELLSDEVAGPLTPAQREYLDEIERGALRLAGLVNDLLDFARLEAGAFRLRLADADAHQLVREVVLSLRPLAAEARLTLETPEVEAPLPLRCDAARVVQVLTNMIGNAIKFTPAGGRVTARASASAEGDSMRFEVQDTGPGIAESDQSRLFERFSQLDASNTRVTGGTGLGLSISKAIVEAHGGRIGVTSQPGQGSTFWFELPTRPVEEL